MLFYLSHNWAKTSYAPTKCRTLVLREEEEKTPRFQFIVVLSILLYLITRHDAGTKDHGKSDSWIQRTNERKKEREKPEIKKNPTHPYVGPTDSREEKGENKPPPPPPPPPQLRGLWIPLDLRGETLGAFNGALNPFFFLFPQRPEIEALVYFLLIHPPFPKFFFFLSLPHFITLRRIYCIKLETPRAPRKEATKAIVRLLNEPNVLCFVLVFVCFCVST